MKTAGLTFFSFVLLLALPVPSFCISTVREAAASLAADDAFSTNPDEAIGNESVVYSWLCCAMFTLPLLFVAVYHVRVPGQVALLGEKNVGSRPARGALLMGRCIAVALLLATLAMRFPQIEITAEPQPFSTTRAISWAEVHKHNRPGDAWLVIDNRVYDISGFVNRHGGGDAILQAAGQEASSYFYTHHRHAMAKVKKVLATLQIGILESNDGLAIENDAIMNYFYDRLQAKIGHLPRRPLAPIITHHSQLMLFAYLFYQTFVNGNLLAAFFLPPVQISMGNQMHAMAHHMLYHPKSEYGKKIYRIQTALQTGDDWQYMGDRVSTASHYYNPNPLYEVADGSWHTSGSHYGHHAYVGNDALDPEVPMRTLGLWIGLRTNFSQPLLVHHKSQSRWEYFRIVYLDSIGRGFLCLLGSIPRALDVWISILWAPEIDVSQKFCESVRIGVDLLFGTSFFFPFIGLYCMWKEKKRLFLVWIGPRIFFAFTIWNAFWAYSIMHWVWTPGASSPYDRTWEDQSFNNSWGYHTFKNSPDVAHLTMYDGPFTPEKIMMCNDPGFIYQGIHHMAPTLSNAYYPAAYESMKETAAHFNITYNHMDYWQMTQRRLNYLKAFESEKPSKAEEL